MTSDRPRVLIAGGGVAALEAMVALRTLAGELVQVHLLAPDKDFAYRPLAVAEPFDVGAVQRFPLPALAGACGAKHQLGSLTSVDPDKRRVRTSRLVEIAFDALLIAVGVRAHHAIPGALTFRGPEDVGAFKALLGDLEAGRLSRIVFAVPSGVSWALPLYELALLTADRTEKLSIRSTEIVLITPEEAPLALFGREGSEAVRALLDEKRIRLEAGRTPSAFDRGELRLIPDDVVAADAVVSLPSLRGQVIAGIPRGAQDFIPTDPYGRVEGLPAVYAAGDITAFPIKQGGLAAQQADAAASTIAAAAGADVEPQPFEPVLRGLLVTGGTPTYLRADIRGGRGDDSMAGSEALWWPPGKIAGRYLGPFLAEQAGLAFRQPEPNAR